MSDIPNLIEQLSHLSSGSQLSAEDANVRRKQLELHLADRCVSGSLESWLPLFLGHDSNFSDSQSYATSNAQRVNGGGGAGPAEALLSMGSTTGPSAQGYIGLTFLVDFIQKNGKTFQTQRKGPSMANYVIQRLSSLLFEVAVVTAASASPAFPTALLNWSRKLAILFTYLLHNNTSELSAAVQSMTELVHFAFDAAVGNASVDAIIGGLPFDITSTSVDAIGRLRGMDDSFQSSSLASSLIVVSLTALHVLLKTACEKKLLQKALKGLQVSVVGTALINGSWLQALYSFAYPQGTPSANNIALAKVMAAKLTARTLKVILAATSFNPSPAIRLYHSARGQAVAGTNLDAANVSSFIIHGLGATLQNFAVNELPNIIRSAINGDANAIFQIDPLSIRANYFMLKAFHGVLTDSLDGAVGAWTSIMPPEVCASQIVSNIFSMLMVLPSPATCASAPEVNFSPSSSSPSFDLFASFEKIFLLCSGSVQHICSMDESAPYYAAVLQTVFPTNEGAKDATMALATSVLRQILVEYLRDDNSVREHLGTAKGINFQQQLLAEWQKDPERHFEELELLTDGDTSEGAAEQLFTSLTGCRSCRLPSTHQDLEGPLLFPAAAWQVVNEMLQYNQSGSAVAAAGGDTSEHELAKLMAYRAIGLGHYTLSEGQDENYKSFFYTQLLPDVRGVNSSPLVQRRAIWCIGMWCESATADMRRDVFATYSTVLSASSNLNPVILLTALNALEHFANDMHFKASELPEGFLQMLFGGLSQLFPIIRSPNVIQSLCGLVFVLVSKSDAMEGLGDAMLRMLAPTLSNFYTEITSENASDKGNEGDDWDEDDDRQGAMIGAVRIVLETLTTAMYSNASDSYKWGSELTGVLLQLLRVLTDPFNHQGSSGHFQTMLEDDAWTLWGALFRTSGVGALQCAPSSMFLGLSGYMFSQEMFERDFEGKPMFLRAAVACWLLIESAAAGGALGEEWVQPLQVMRSALQTFAEATIGAAMTTADEDLLLVAAEIAMLLTALPATTQISAPVFMSCVGNYLFGNPDSDLEANASSPILLTLFTYTVPRCIQPSTPAPAALADKVNVIADVTSSHFSLSRLAALSDLCVAGGLLDFSACPQDAATLVGVAETVREQLKESYEEVPNNSNVNGELIAEALGDDRRPSPHTQRLEQLLLA